MAQWYRWKGQDLELDVKVNPKAASDSVEASEERLRVRITAAPVDNKANKHLIRYMARTFKVAPSKVQILRGEHQSLKTLSIQQPVIIPDFMEGQD